MVATYDWGKEVRRELPADEAKIEATVRWLRLGWVGDLWGFVA